MHEFVTRRRVEFADTDMAGIMHFARYAVYMETAEHELLRAIGTEVHFEHEGLKVGWPRVRIELDYAEPARFGDVVEICVAVLRKGTKSMTYGFTFSCDGQRLATGRSTSVCCAVDEDGKLHSIAIPDFIADRLEEAPG